MALEAALEMECAQADLFRDRIESQRLIKMTVDQLTGLPNLINVRAGSLRVGFAAEAGPEAGGGGFSRAVKESHKSPGGPAARA